MAALGGIGITCGILFLGLIVSVQGVQYDCIPGERVAYTPSGTFLLPTTEEPSPRVSCTLTLARDLFRTPTSTLLIRLESFYPVRDVSCEEEYLLIDNKYRYCSLQRDLWIDVQPSDEYNSPQISYYTYTPLSNSSFTIQYIIYDDLYATHNTIAGTPLIIHQSASPSYNKCTLQVNVSNSDRLIITALSVDSESELCPHTDLIYLETQSSVRLCQGPSCLTDPLDVTQTDVVSVVLLPDFVCRFYWKLTVQSLSKVMDICSLTGSELILPEGTIASPGYPAGFRGPLNCSLTISARFEVVAVTVKYYNLRRSACENPLNDNPCNCGDGLIINKTAACGKMPGSGLEKAYVVKEPLDVKLVTTGDLNSNEGFYLIYRGYSNATDICASPSQELAAPLVIKSPNYPSNYPIEQSCTINVDVSSMAKVEVKFVAFNLEEDDDCSFDYLSVNGERFCGNKAGQMKVLDLTSADKLQLHFKSDGSTVFEGFYISIDNHIIETTTSTTTPTPKASSMSMSSIRSNGANTPLPEVSVATGQTVPVVLDESEEEAVTYAENITAVKSDSPLPVHYSIVDEETTHTTAYPPSTDANNRSEQFKSGCQVPWYYWIISLIAILLAVLITMTIFLIKLKRLKVVKYTPSEADTEGSRDGLTNPVYYFNSHYSNGNYSNSPTLLGNPFFTNRDRVPAGKRVYINKNSMQTTV